MNGVKIKEFYIEIKTERTVKWQMKGAGFFKSGIFGLFTESLTYDSQNMLVL